MRIVLDAMGGDHAPAEVVRGAVIAAQRLNIDITLVGRRAVVEPLLRREGKAVANPTLLDADDVIEMDEHGATAARAKRQSSIMVGMRELREGRAQGFVSAGNTGAVMAAAVLVLGRVRGIERPALATVFPSAGKRTVLLLDVGANSEAKAVFLHQAAHMGSAYAAVVMHRPSPRVGLLSIGEEASKGSALVQDVHAELMRDPGVRFIGNVEGTDIPRGEVDVVVTDGFTGNVAIKVAEGVAEFILTELRAVLTSRMHYKLAAAVLRPAFRQLRGRIDYAEYGGAPLLGVNGVVIVAHGRSDARAVFNAVRVARDAAAGDVVGRIAAAVHPPT